MRPAPGTFLWLLAHDMRQNWRRFAGMLGSIGGARPMLVTALAVVGAHAMAWPVARFAAPLWRDLVQTGADAGPLAAIVAGLVSWMLAQSLFATTRNLYDRGDLDLLLGSPLPAGRVFAAKATAIATGTLGSLAVLVLPFTNMLALVDGPGWLVVYPVLIALAVLSAAVALLVAIGLFFLAGPRRARLMSQLAAAVIGGGFVLVAQIVAMLPQGVQDAALAWLAGWSPAPSQTLASPLAWPLAALRGEAWSVVALLAVSVSLFAAAVVLLGDRFARASLAAVGVASGRVRLPADGRVRFRSGLGRSLRRKEWRLLMRDPSLFTQIGLQIVYTIPLVVVLVRSGSLPTGVAIAPAIVVIAAQVAASLAWITVSGEDAPELIAAAPVAPSAVDRAKLSALALPVLAMVALPILALALVAPLAALAALAMASAASASTALLNLWHPMPGNRRGMLRRHQQSKLLAMIEHIIAILWAVATVLLLMGVVWCLAPAVLALVVLAAAVPGRLAPLARRLRPLRRSPQAPLSAGATPL